MNAPKLVLLSMCCSAVCFAQNLQVIPVPWTALDPTVPHSAYNSHATTFKAIARGGNGTYLYEWDFNGDGVYDFSVSTSNRYDLSTRFTYPNQAQDLLMLAKVRVTSNGQTVEATYPVQIFVDVPANPANATARQLQVMRNVSLDDGLWFLHTQMSRSGDESNLLTGAQVTGSLGPMTTLTTGAFLEALGRNQQYPAFPAAYLGAMPSPMENAARWDKDPYAEDAMRLCNNLLANSTVVNVSANDEVNLTGFYPEVTATPIPGTDDGFGLIIGSSPGDQTLGYAANALRGLALAHLAGFVAQVGDSNRVLGRRMEFIVQQLVDGLVWAQNDAGTSPGSWYYFPNANSDLVGELGGGAIEIANALWLTEQTMRGSGVVVPNLVKARLVNYALQVAIACPQGGQGVAYFANDTGCELSLSTLLPISLGWVGANLFSPTDTRLAFPSYNGRTRGQLRTVYDASLIYVTNAFSGSTSTSTGWDTGFVLGGDFSRTDGQGDHWSMVQWARAVRTVEPEPTTLGANDWARQFARYLVNNQANNGGWNWVFSGSLGQNNDNSLGDTGRAAWALHTLSPDDMAPVAKATASTLTAAEGTAITFSAFSTAPGTFVWAFGNGESRTGASVNYAYPDNGTFTVTLTVTTPGGSVATDSLQVTISNAPPVPDAGPNQTLNEGDLVSFSGTWTDPGTADTHTVLWTFADGTTATTAQATHTYANQGTFNVQFAVTDDDGDVGTATAVITVLNVAPTITSTPGTSLSLGAVYSYTLTFTDPGTADTQTCSAQVAPAGATLTGCTLSWTPTAAPAVPAPFSLCVTDSDAARTCQSFSVSVSVVDTDGDGLPDAWETTHFGSLSQSAQGDADQDGLTNLEEFLGGTDPTVYDGPSAPTAPQPTCGGSVSDARPTLTVSNATDPQLTPLRYDFEVYDDAALTSLVLGMADVPAGTTATSWRVPVTLIEDTRFWWRARARDNAVHGAWTQPACSFLVNAVNSPPGAPSLDSPSVGAQVATLTPTLTIGNAVDPEGDTLSYEFQVFLAGAVVAQQQGVVSGTGSTAWQVTNALTEDATYTWQARAVSAGGPSPWSALGRFTVNTTNTAPPAPVLVSPQNGTMVDTLTPTLVFLPAADADGDALTFDWQVALDESFTTPLASGTGVTATRLTLSPPLTEDARVCWRVRANDGQAQSAWDKACFKVSAVDGAPNVPTPANPSAASVVATLTPTFSWAGAVDPEGAQVFYDVELSAGATVIATVTQVSGNTAVVPTPLVDGTSYSWRVRATTGGTGPASEYSAASQFQVTLPVTPTPTPAASGGCSQTGGWASWLAPMVLALWRRRRS